MRGSKAALQKVFDESVKAAHRQRAGVTGGERLHDPVLRSVADRLVDRVLDCDKTFANALLLGGCQDVVTASLTPGTKGLERVTHVDSSPNLLEHASSVASNSFPSSSCDREFVTAEQESLLEHVPEQSFDLAIACLGLHWANDLPGAMVQARRALKPDGFFLAAIFGEETLPVRSAPLPLPLHTV
jgi:SAM-dependent methyltransferase